MDPLLSPSGLGTSTEWCGLAIVWARDAAWTMAQNDVDRGVTSELPCQVLVECRLTARHDDQVARSGRRRVYRAGRRRVRGEE